MVMENYKGVPILTENVENFILWRSFLENYAHQIQAFEIITGQYPCLNPPVDNRYSDTIDLPPGMVPPGPLPPFVTKPEELDPKVWREKNAKLREVILHTVPVHLVRTLSPIDTAHAQLAWLDIHRSTLSFQNELSQQSQGT